MRLYHFTCIEHLESIMSRGLSRGTSMTSVNDERQCVWFTTEQHAVPGAHGLISVYDKTAVRIAVEFKAREPKLWRWIDFARFCKADRRWIKIVDETGGGLSHTWFIYRGVIAPSRFAEVLINKGQGDHHA